MNIPFLKALVKRLGALPNEKFDIQTWQGRNEPTDSFAHNEQEFHACGNTACIAGYAYLMPEWPDHPEEWTDSPATMLGGKLRTDEYAFARVMDMSVIVASALTINFGHKHCHDEEKAAQLFDWWCWAPHDWPNLPISDERIVHNYIGYKVGQIWDDWNREDAIKAINYVIERYEAMKSRNLNRLIIDGNTIFFQGESLPEHRLYLALDLLKKKQPDNFPHTNNQNCHATVGSYPDGSSWIIIFDRDQLPTSMLEPNVDVNYELAPRIAYLQTVLDRPFLVGEKLIIPYANATNYPKEIA